VGIVACDASEARIALTPTFTALQAIGLRFGIGDTFDAREFHIPPGGVTSAAKIHRIGRAELSGVENGSFRWGRHSRYLRRLHGGHVIRAGPVAGFAGHAGNEIFLVKLLSNVRCGGVASEASTNFSRVHRAIHGFLEIFIGGYCSVRSEVKRFQSVEVGDAGFIEFSITLFEEVRLTHAVGSERPEETGSQSAGSVGKSVDAMGSGGFNFVTILVEREFQLGMGLQDV